MKKISIIAGLCAACLVSAGVSARNDIRWDYVGAGYTDAAADGPYIEGSFRLDNSWVVDGSFARLSAGNADVNQLQAGVKFLTGFRLDFSPTTQTYLLAGIENVSGDADDTGGYAGLGLRHPLTPEVELYSEAAYHSLGDDHGSLAGGIAYFLSRDWAVRSNIVLNSGDSKNEFRFGVSYQF